MLDHVSVWGKGQGIVEEDSESHEDTFNPLLLSGDDFLQWANNPKSVQPKAHQRIFQSDAPIVSERLGAKLQAIAHFDDQVPAIQEKITNFHDAVNNVDSSTWASKDQQRRIARYKLAIKEFEAGERDKSELPTKLQHLKDDINARPNDFTRCVLMELADVYTPHSLRSKSTIDLTDDADETHAQQSRTSGDDAASLSIHEFYQAENLPDRVTNFDPASSTIHELDENLPDRVTNFDESQTEKHASAYTTPTADQDQ